MMKLTSLFGLILLLFGCAASNPPKQSQAHINKTQVANAKELDKASIPKIIESTPYLPIPKPEKKPETYTVVVNEVPVKELLFAIARDANIDIDIVGDIEGTVTLNAINQTLAQIMERIAYHVPIKYSFKHNTLIIEKDAPYLKTYNIDYLNISRSSESQIELATQIAATGAGSESDTESEVGNNSFTQVKNTINNTFWATLEQNIRHIVSSGEENLSDSGENIAATETTATESSSSTEAATTSTASESSSQYNDVIVNKESGLITVYTTDLKHKKIEQYIDRVVSKAGKQVLIEATIVEVELNDEYQSGVDWTVVASGGAGLSINQNLTGNNLTTPSFFSATFTDPANALGAVTGTIKSLEQFGNVQVLSSPKIIALNNQTAVLKVVDNRVYFTTEVNVQPATTSTPRIETFESTLHTVPIGFVMNVTPYISTNKEILLNVRPTISRILGFVEDPNPSLATAGVISKIPEIQVREMESLLRMNSGQVAIIGGLMQDKVEKNNSGVPGLNQIPYVKNLFSYKQDKIRKTELLVFIKSTLINTASVDKDLKKFYDFLPERRRTQSLGSSGRE